MSWIGVCDAEQVQEDFPFSGNVDGKEIGVYLIDGEYYALEDVCPHAYALLSQGFVEDGKVECPLHEAVFDVKTGQCLHGPGGRNLNRYPVRVFENQIWQTRSREPENWEMNLIATLEDLFEQGVETLPELVNGLNAVRMHDQQGEPWSDASFQAFLQVNGY